jgi:putative inorganic carbon (HCO3(-)) transporter
MLRLVAFIVCMTFGFGAAIYSRFGALLFYVWFALFRPQEWVWTDITGLRLSLWLGILLVVPSLLSGVLPNLTHPLSVGSLLFLLTGLIAQLNAVRPDFGWQWMDFLARLIVVCLLAVTLINSQRRFAWTVAIMAASLGYYTAKAGVASFVGGGVQFYDGLGGAFVDNNGYAMGTVMIMPLLLATAQNLELVAPDSSKRGADWIRLARFGLYVSVALSAVTVVSTFSRAGFLGLGVAALVFVALQKRRVHAGIALAAVVLIAVMVVPIPAGYLSRIDTIRTYEEIEEDSAMSRPHFWRVAVDMARAQPLGVGLRNFDATYDRYDFLNGRYGHNRSVHSSHFQVLAENGFVGFAVWTLMFIMAFRYTFRARGRARLAGLSAQEQRFLFTMSNALIVSMMAFLVGGAFIALSLNDLTWLTFALVASLDRLSAGMIVAADSASERDAGRRPRETPVLT